MEVMIFLALCLGGYWLWKTPPEATTKEDKAKFISRETYFAVRKMLQIQNSHINESEKNVQIAETIVGCVKKLEAEAKHDIVSLESFYVHYNIALHNGNIAYITKANKYLLSEISNNVSLEQCIMIFKILIHNKPPLAFDYKSSWMQIDDNNFTIDADDLAKERTVNVCDIIYREVMKVHNSDIDKSNKSIRISEYILAGIESIKEVLGRSVVCKDSFSQHYSDAFANNDIQYLNGANEYIINKLLSGSSLENTTRTIAGFVRNPPPREYNYLLRKDGI